MRIRVASLVSMVIAALLAPIAMGADASQAHTITTSGEAVIYVVPDEVSVGFGVLKFDANLDKAEAANEEASKTLVAAIKGLGIEEKNIQVDMLRVSVEYGNNRVWQGIQGYQTQRSYSVKLKDVKLLAKLVDVALKNGANELYGVELRSTELRKYRDQARSMAVKAAKEKAAALAKDLDCGVGKPWQITETAGGYFGYYNNQFNNSAQNAMQVAPGGAADGESDLPLGQIAIRANVSVVFDLTDH